MKDITILIPLFNNNDDNFLSRIENSLNSSKNIVDNEGEVFLIGDKDTLGLVSDPFFKKIENNGSTDFCSQVNLGVSKCKTKYFMVLEQDDIVMPKWFNSFKDYERVNTDTSMFVPLTEVVDYNALENGPMGYINEALWASSFSNEIGFFDLDCLKQYMNFNFTGSIINKKDFETVGGLKASMKLSFWYEFIMRFINNGKKAFVIPKVGYQHAFGRSDSLSDFYNKTMKPEEAEWWIDLAQKEYLYKKDRNKTYEE